MDLTKYSNEHIRRVLEPTVESMIEAIKNSTTFLGECWITNEVFKPWWKKLAGDGISKKTIYVKQNDIANMGEAFVTNHDIKGSIKFTQKCFGNIVLVNKHNIMSIVILKQEHIEKLTKTGILDVCHYLHLLLAPSNYDMSPDNLLDIHMVFDKHIVKKKSFVMQAVPQPVQGFHINSAALKITSTWGLKRWFPEANINTRGDIYTYISLVSLEETRKILTDLKYTQRRENPMALYKNYVIGTLIKVMVPHGGGNKTANGFNIIVTYAQMTMVTSGGEVAPIYHVFFALINCIFINTTVGSNKTNLELLTKKIELIMGCFRDALRLYEVWLKELDEAQPVQNLLVQRANHSPNKLEVYGTMVPARILQTMSPITINSSECYPYGHKIVSSMVDESIEFLENDYADDDDDETGDLTNSLQIGCKENPI